MSGLVGTIAGIGQLVGLAQDQQNRPSPPSAPAPARRGGAVPPSA
jgi:hypothetical protein